LGSKPGIAVLHGFGIKMRQMFDFKDLLWLRCHDFAQNAKKADLNQGHLKEPVFDLQQKNHEKSNTYPGLPQT